MANSNTHQRTLPRIEQDIRQALASMEAAQDEATAAKAYAALKASIEEHLTRSAELRSQFYQTRDTVIKQAHQIHEAELIEAIGQPAPSASQVSAVPAAETPDVITVQNSPDFFFIRLSYGFTNIRHIIELDVKSKTLFTTSGTRNLSPDDTRTILFHVKNFRP